MSYDILKKVRKVLKDDATISAAVGTNVRVAEQPVPRVAKQITLRKSYGKSNSILNSTNPTIFVNVWVLQKETSEPYKACADIVERVLALLNRKGESLNESTLVVNQMVKTDCTIKYDDSQEYWVGAIVFDAVTNE